ncbi:hypothetical protein [Flavilitoribacter nigricans]|uniref:Uncharacterized protein n=1 Tax=Flavilitoribacter nigricans (strain ATCC 23147 / DSM 23189 / NBRC 102662 / NCIMB 1420 / SS-2) TaxID=1122177 RepID=A0A2D0MWR3_FLAN2|nr:hypothetical protein [Flavilitoribacter nigricans]PHN00566.1 hypothetical protein CRP01_41560 [Flavilitoribacter nigricans DSM 23189 = NBRC 102662]
MRIITILTLALTFCSACDPGVVNKYVIKNATPFNITIESKLEYGSRSISEKDSIKVLELKPDSESLIMEYGEIGNAHDKGVKFLEGLDTIIVKSGNKRLEKDIFDQQNWKYKVLKRGLLSMDEVEYTFTLSRDDLK